MTDTVYHNDHSVDNPTRYTRAQARVGGILSGASRRFAVRDRHALVKQLRDSGLSLRVIAARTGYNFSTVSRILSGKIKSCLTRAATLAAGPVTLLRKRRGVARTNLYSEREKESRLEDGQNCQFCSRVERQVCPGCGFEKVLRMPAEVLEREREQKPWLAMGDFRETQPSCSP